MAPDRAPKVPKPQRIYGEIVYWITIVSGLICMVGPLISMISVDGNVLNPHSLFANIFKGEKPMSIWALSSTETVRLDVRTEGDGRKEHPGLAPEAAVELLFSLPQPPAGAGNRPALLIGENLHLARLPAEEVEEDMEWLLVAEDRKIRAAEARDQVLAVYGREVFSNGHFWARNITAGDGFTQFGLALGCSVGLWALIGVAFAYFREKVYLYVWLSIWVAFLIFLSASGIVAKGH